ncbi:MAG: metallophosphoesterase [Candidatus Pacearchaeota archaeon]
MGVVNIFLREGFLLQPDLVNFIDEREASVILELLKAIKAPRVISMAFLKQNLASLIVTLNSFLELGKFDKDMIYNIRQKLNKIKRASNEEKKDREESEEKEKREQVSSEKDYLLTTKINEEIIKPKKIEVKHFLAFFKHRYEWFKELLRDRRELTNLTSIDKLPINNQNVSIIGIVAEKRETKNRNVILTLEDGKGIVNVLINRDRAVYEKSNEIVEDEVIGVKGFGNRDIIFASDIIFPEAINVNNKSCALDSNILFISDTHVGSDKFLEPNLRKAIRWINCEEGSEKQKEKAKKISHIFFVGDIVDGVGVYPGQENELEIKDIIEQYKAAYEIFDEIRKDIKLIFIPGNHDATRLTEPQVFNSFSKPLQKLENAEFLPNPTYYSIYNYKLLLYHGYSFDYYANSVYSLKAANAYANPEHLLKFFLRKRHLAPTHGSTTYSPADEDFFIIKKIPDVFVTAHIHKSAVGYYNNIALISGSCWQSKTPYQEKFGHVPDPCKIPIFNTKTKKIQIIDFS